ncbi:PREDICTED: protein EPIDERMAL PATTERNING FACTOR 1-like, partial [Camelina sativa]|uniref:Epidermal patterning factor-like protein n=1 Tax=Camelina sativa TaxID=90675 RepID=A0ABM0Y9W6_CAMSA
SCAGHHHVGMTGTLKRQRRRPDTVQVAGSRLPDCSHACGSCSPCRLVMVSFVCATLEEAETCPMAYKCMCNNKSYPVP